MTLINLSGGLKNGRCYSILGNVNVCTQGLEKLARTMNLEEHSKTANENDLWGNNEC